METCFTQENLIKISYQNLLAKKKDEKSICVDLLKVLQVIGNWKMSTFSVFIVIKG
jgi:hypothetical protein